MSSMLEQAIIDAKLLRETATKRAQERLVENYASEIKQAVDLMLEQDEAPMGPDLGSSDTPAFDMEPPAPTGAAAPEAQKVVDRIPAAFLGEDNMQEIEFNLDSIVEKIENLQKDLNIPAMPSFDAPAHTPVEQGNQSRIPPEALAETVNEEENTNADMMTEEDTVQEEQIEEEMTVDMKNVTPGGIQGNEIELKKQVAVSKALESQNEDLQEQLNSKVEELDVMEAKLQSMLTKLQETKGKLKKSVELNVQLKEGFEFLTKKINDVNLLNARLLYTNKVLGNVSLNEKQKKQIAETISKSKTVDEAKTIYETLQRSAQTVTEKKTVPQSLTEAVARASSPFLPRVSQTTVDPVADRWQRMAGIKK